MSLAYFYNHLNDGVKNTYLTYKIPEVKVVSHFAQQSFVKQYSCEVLHRHVLQDATKVCLFPLHSGVHEDTRLSHRHAQGTTHVCW